MRVRMAQPCPPWKHTALPDGDRRGEVGVVEHDGGRFAAQLQEVRLSVAPPFSTIRLPTAVDPVNEIRSTFGRQGELLADEVVRGGDHVEDAAREVGLLGHEAAEPRGVPRRVRGRA